jgi:hypothetical protein
MNGECFTIPKTMKAWVLGNVNELVPVTKPIPEPGPSGHDRRRITIRTKEKRRAYEPQSQSAVIGFTGFLAHC